MSTLHPDPEHNPEDYDLILRALTDSQRRTPRPPEQSLADALAALVQHYARERNSDPRTIVEALGVTLTVALADVCRDEHLFPDQVDALLDRCHHNLRTGTWECLRADAEPA